MAADLRKCCSEDDLATVPWRFLLSFPCSSIYLKQGVSLTFEGDDSLLQLLLIMSRKKRLARDIITVARCMFTITHQVSVLLISICNILLLPKRL